MERSYGDWVFNASAIVTHDHFGPLRKCFRVRSKYPRTDGRKSPAITRNISAVAETSKVPALERGRAAGVILYVGSVEQ